MLRNYLKIAWRNARKNKVSTFVNIVGLTLGLTCCMLITAYVLDEFSYDHFHKNADQIVLFQQFEGTPGSGGKFATDLKSRFAPVTNTARLTRIKPLIAHRQTAGYESQFWFADSSVFNVFTLPLVQGNPRTALTERLTDAVKLVAARFLREPARCAAFFRFELLSAGTPAEATAAAPAAPAVPAA